VRRWFRLLVIALLLPAYGLAAIGTLPFVEDDGAAQSRTGAPAADVTVLIAELGDTTDDVSDHCLPHPAAVAAPQPPVAPPSLGRRLALDAPLAQPLRPPCRNDRA